MFIDTHIHLYKEYFNDFDDFLNKSKEMGCILFMNNGVSHSSNLEVIDSLKYEEVFGCIGIHPEDANSYQNEDLTFIKDNIKNSKIVAIGEIGLDYHYDGYSREKEIELLERQLKIAEENNIPVVIHSRDAFDDTYKILSKYKVTGVIHSFSGTYEEACKYIELGFVIGVGGITTFKNSNNIDVIRKIGIKNIILETDSPYLAPVPVRGHVNISGNIKYIVDYLCGQLNIDKNVLENEIVKNTLKTFPKLKIKS